MAQKLFSRSVWQGGTSMQLPITDFTLSHAIDLLDYLSPGERCSVGADLLMAELERRHDGGPGKDIRMPSRAFDKLPSAVRKILDERVSVDDRRAA